MYYDVVHLVAVENRLVEHTLGLDLVDMGSIHRDSIKRLLRSGRHRVGVCKSDLVLLFQSRTDT